MTGDSIGFEEIVVDLSVASLNPAIYNPPAGDPAAKAFITAEGGPMRYRLDGVDPTDTTGHLLMDSDFLELKSIYLINKFRAIKTTVNPGKLSVTYES
jgi:hypothetical protein